MAQVFGTSIEGVQTLAEELLRDKERIVFGINENTGGRPQRAGYGYILALDYTTSANYLYWRGGIYVPGLFLPLPPAEGNLFLAIRVIVNWDVPDLNWFIDC